MQTSYSSDYLIELGHTTIQDFYTYHIFDCYSEFPTSDVLESLREQALGSGSPFKDSCLTFDKRSKTLDKTIDYVFSSVFWDYEEPLNKYKLDNEGLVTLYDSKNHVLGYVFMAGKDTVVFASNLVLDLIDEYIQENGTCY